MATSQEAAEDLSDFDNSDEDLASLLGDEDDDIFSKKIYGDSPAKKLISEVSESVVRKGDYQTKASPKISAEASAKQDIKTLEVKTPSKDDFTYDILNDFIDSSANKNVSVDRKSSIEKGNTKSASVHSEESDFIDDLGLSRFSPTKDMSISSPSKKQKNKFTKEHSNHLDSVTSESISKPSGDRRDSFFDNILQKLSPKHETKKESKNVQEKGITHEEAEEDILGAYIPTASQKNENISDAITRSPKKRGSLLKQVSFKDLPDDSLESDLNVSKTIASPVEESSMRKKSFSDPKKIENITSSKRTEKIGSSKDEDMDWLNFFKESPKKSLAEHSKQKDGASHEKVDLPATKESKLGIRRQSSADWLGLSDSKILDNDEKPLNSKDEKINLKDLNLSRPKTADAPIIKPRHPDISKNIEDWNARNDFSKDNNTAIKPNISHVLKRSKFSENRSSTAFTEKMQEPNIESSIILQSKYHSKEPSNEQAVSNDTLADTFISKHAAKIDSTPEYGFSIARAKELPPQSVHQNIEHSTAIHSMQLLLDNSMQERNKLIEEIEKLKLIYEEKIQSIEEFHKTEKKATEDSYKTLESSLKQEFEYKIKTLEESLKLVTKVKEKEETDFKEKLKKMLKEHNIEMERLKNLHNQSVNIMKEDHEDALSRLKRLKEQEVEAVLNTQVHSKSLQHLSDQLEARANELASLQNKVEERNQTTLREKQALLDAKEKDLKALQSRLQRQLDDSGDERTRLQQLILRLEGRLQKLTMEGEEDRWDVQQMKAKLTIQQKYLEEEQKLNQYQMEKEKEKLRISQDSLLHEQKIVLMQLAQERQQLTQEKIDIQSLLKNIKEEDAKLNVRKLREESYIESQKQFLAEEKNKLHFDKEQVKQEFHQLERERDSLQREKQQFRNEKESFSELEINLKRKLAELQEMEATAARDQEKTHREHAAAVSIKTEHQFKMQQYTQQMEMLMDKERKILSEKEKLFADKLEFEQTKHSVLCTKCKLFVENPVQAPPYELNMPVVLPLPNFNGMSNQVQQSFIDPNLVIWHIGAQKDRQFLQEELAFMRSLKDSSKKRCNK